MGSYVITQKKIVSMKWKDYKIMLENESASVSRILSVFFLSSGFAVYFYLVKMFYK